MKFIFLTDTHIKGSNPKSRKDNFYETLKMKFNEVGEICDRVGADYILHGGDWFDRPDVSPAVVKDFAQIIMSFKRPVFTVAGNHDIYGHNPGTLGRTMLGLLEGVGIITLLDIGERIVLEKEGIKVQLTGCPYNYDIDSEGSLAGYVVKKAEDVHYAVNMVHGMLLNKTFFEGMRYTLIDNIKDTEADITLAGHYHSGFGVIQKSGKYFVNPGSLVRIANASGEIARRPKVVYIELSDSITIKEIELLSAKEGEEVLDRLELERNLERTAKLGLFYREISTSSEYKKIDMKMIIEEIAASDNLDTRVKEEAVRRIIAAGENLQEED